MKALAALVLASLLPASLLPAEVGAEENPVMLRYRERYHQAIKSASAAYNDAVSSAMKVYLEALDNLAREDTRTGALNAAVALRKERAKTVSDAPLLFEGRVAAPAGEWNIIYSNDYKRTYKIDRNGKVTDSRGIKFTFRVEQDAFFLDGSDGKIERLTFTPYRLFVEHWNPGSDFAEGKPPSEFGIGTPVGKE